MEAKEKAYQIFTRNLNVIELNSKLPNDQYKKSLIQKEAKRCSLLAINFHLAMWIGSIESKNYWKQVKQEIENIKIKQPII
jgi:hypothetical protein